MPPVRLDWGHVFYGRMTCQCTPQFACAFLRQQTSWNRPYMEDLRLFIKSLAGILFFLVILFISAGRMDYYQGWIYSALSLFGLAIDLALTGSDIDLRRERSKPPKDAKQWDKRILALSALITVAAYIVAGLDSGRYQWSPRLHWGVFILGIVLIVGGQVLFLISKKTNKFFSSVVRVQYGRGHTVCNTGLYNVVRHPGYLGMIASWAGFPLVLGSLWSFIPIAVAIILLVVRTSLEDNTLRDELAGYGQYIQKTRYKLVPGVW